MAWNENRVPWIEAWIERQPDGVLHQAPKQGDRPARPHGKRPEYDQDEIQICLNCPRERCVLDKDIQCRRLTVLLRKRKEKKQHDKGD